MIVIYGLPNQGTVNFTQMLDASCTDMTKLIALHSQLVAMFLVVNFYAYRLLK